MAYVESTTKTLPKMTPMMQQYFEIKEAHRDSILFFRMGDFYEMFMDDAKRAAGLLDIALTTRDKNSAQPIPMCGVPHHSAAGYIQKLIEHGLQVAICEQVEDPKLARGIVKRRVVQIVTPGTYLREESLPQGAKSYVAAAIGRQGRFALAYCDISTGDFATTETDNASDLVAEIASLAPKELVVPEASTDLPVQTLRQRNPHMVIRKQPDSLFDEKGRRLLDHFDIHGTRGVGLHDNPHAVQACTALISYVKNLQLGDVKHLKRVQYYERSDFMVMDHGTRANLDLLSSSSEFEGDASLFSVINSCRTKLGERLLRSWIERPLISRAAIEDRLTAVRELVGKFAKVNQIVQELKQMHDIERLISRVALRKASARHLVALCESLERLPALSTAVEQLSGNLFADLRKNLQPLPEFVTIVRTAIVAEPPANLGDGNTIRSGFNTELDQLTALQTDSKAWLAKYESAERERSGIGNLKVRYNRVFGYYIEISRSNLKRVPDNYVRKQTLANAERFITEELKVYEDKILSAADKISLLEQQLFEQTLNQVDAFHSKVQIAARAVAKLDVICSFAKTAVECDYSQPEILEDGELSIVDGRHPIIEQSQNRVRFVPNSLFLNCDSRQLIVLTGPNMAGKSTLLRQTAIIVLLAHMGSFVPAKQAKIGLVDRIFTRIGAGDDLAMGRSTFMVEMEETATILQRATSKSLLVLDEIGRGTSTFDGLSIARAVVEHIHDEIGARTLFATHYHEIADCSATLARVHNMHFAVQEQGGSVIFLHELIDGAANRSYGIHVGKLAGLPNSVLKRAKVVLDDLEAQRGLSAISTAPRIS